ncbi:unnamed protein product [Bursaphelenchus xylophilus]|uniref:(pine wood nematode) hypothetical protein n=1 Tax=Bursaphelenchus xylophilus TaxID=6326 RepID=A0A1I7RZW9_BURXY|nr:unnamed protein product [Bursaphelenchus xylophilus]CAG9109173.1 unnamed protein product [Bursaphelenchus xylophilus]
MVFHFCGTSQAHSEMKEHTYKLTYLDRRGLAEPVRLMFHYLGIPFEDERIDPTELTARYDSLPFGQVPVLLIDDKTKLCQSHAIYRFVARRYHLAGKSEMEQALVDSYAELLHDFGYAVQPYFAVVSGRIDGDKYQIYDEIIVPTAKKFGSYFDRIYREANSGFFAPSGLTFVDFIATNIYDTALRTGMDAVCKIQSLKEVHDRIHALPKLQRYLSTRRRSDF